MIHRHRRPRIATTALLLGVLLGAPAPAAQSREQATLAEEAALLQRQVARLRKQMQVLLERFEAEGRTHAAGLLRSGLQFLDERLSDAGSRTVEELMEASREEIEGGQPVRALENQARVVAALERLLAILMDRRGLENLEQSLEELRAIRAELGRLADEENALREATAALRQSSTTQEQRDLLAGIESALARQGDLLEQTERAGRHSGATELEGLERDLEELLRRQTTDREVLEAWDPADDARLAAARPALDAARREAARAARLAAAAQELRDAAGAARQASERGALQEAQRALEQAAERERRHERASGDEAAARAAEALERGAGTLHAAQPDAASRAEAAGALEAEAAALERAAGEQQAGAEREASAARAALDELASSPSSAGQAARDLAGKLAAAQAGSGAQEPPTAEREAQALDEALRALDEAAAEQELLDQALAASQAAQGEAARRMQAGLAGVPQAESPPLERARAGLGAAAQAMRQASEQAAGENAPAAAEAAREAEEALREALSALAAERDERSLEGGEAAELRAGQEELAREVSELERQARSAEMSPSAEQPLQESLESARESMQQAAQGLSSGKSSSAARSQREAMTALRKAAESARSGAGSQPSPEAREAAQDQAEEQERIRQELLELAQRNQEREASQAPGQERLESAGQSASRAKQSLSQGDLGGAQEEEQETEQEIRSAMQQLAEEEEQYQKLRQEELLFRIGEEVRTLIEEHQKQMAATREVDAERQPGERASRGQRLRLRRIARDEETLGQRCSELSGALVEEQSLVFGEILTNAHQDLGRIARDLDEAGGYQSGERVQALQQDVEQTLAWLAEALDEERERRRQQAGNPPQPQDPSQNRLVPDVAELKLLRRLEVEILDRIDQMMAVHPELDAEGGAGEVDPLLLEDIGRLAHRHERTSELFESFRRRLGLPDPVPEPEEPPKTD